MNAFGLYMSNCLYAIAFEVIHKDIEFDFEMI